MTKIILMLLLQFLIASQCMAERTCSELSRSDDIRAFSELKAQVQSAKEYDDLREIALRWIEIGVIRRDEAIACMEASASSGIASPYSAANEGYWAISYSYRVLADTLRELLARSDTKELKKFRQDVIERIDAASESFDQTPVR
jgi:hypothetical protein